MCTAPSETCESSTKARRFLPDGNALVAALLLLAPSGALRMVDGAQQVLSACLGAGDYSFAPAETNSDGCAPAATRLASAVWQPTASHADIMEAGGLEILDEYIADRIRQLEERSETFRNAMRLARMARIPIVIGTPVQVQQRVAHRLSLGDRTAPGYLGEFLVRLKAPESVDIDLIVIRVALDDVRRVQWWRRLLGTDHVRRRIHETTDAILIHEIWGHLAPVLEAGDNTGNCPDPRAEQAVVDSCVMKRENALRRELGLNPREKYAISIR